MIYSIVSSVVTVLVIGGIVYLIFRSRNDSDKDHEDLKDAYFFFVSFIALSIVFWAVADLARVIIDKQFFAPTQYPASYRYTSSSNDAYLRQISLRVSSFLVAFPVYIFHWFKANSKPDGEIDKKHKRFYLFAVMIFSALLTLGMGMGLTYDLVNQILGVSSSSNSELAYTLPYALLGLAVWVTHYSSYSKMTNNKKTKSETDKLHNYSDSPSKIMADEPDFK